MRRIENDLYHEAAEAAYGIRRITDVWDGIMDIVMFDFVQHRIETEMHHEK